MYCYSAYALTIASEIELPDLAPGTGEPDITIRQAPVPRNRNRSALDDYFAFNTLAGRFHIHGGNEITVDPLPGAEPDAVRTILMGRMMAFLLRQRRWLPLHASAVMIGGQVALFVGPSGCGKSTTAAAFHVSGRQVIADDVAAVRVIDGRCMVRPAWPQVRLFEDSNALLAGLDLSARFQIDKHTVKLTDGLPQRILPVAGIFALGYGDRISVVPVPAMDAVKLFSSNSFLRPVKMGHVALAAHFSDCVSVAAAVAVRKLMRPRILADLPEVIRQVELTLDGAAADTKEEVTFVD